MELHHPIMSKLWDLGGRTKRKKEYEQRGKYSGAHSHPPIREKELPEDINYGMEYIFKDYGRP